MFTNPIYQQIPVLRAEVDSYNEALNNSKALENERDKLTSKFNSINKEDLDKLEKLLPDNIDNIRLILEIEKIASPYGMVLKDVKYNAEESVEAKPTNAKQAGSGAKSATSKDYKVLNMEFSVSGTYNNFINFTKDLESNLRIVDISSISFSSEVDSKTNPTGLYKYNFKIKTYWLKN
jgi:Tfp pilus assembly protein PilO